ncbi:hypothetical protein RQM65_07210 [Pricia sp. S334]|uniref:Uncharacterized protein n=1 Tax=Pricia mediterranea TaxID=3076079 RepID=A0ABU3L3X6_9FLAO|nr:hypothetical protein [Pricia sp. S334]MDT7828446.1 hypothetical protein [Pricia sp. S334]
MNNGKNTDYLKSKLQDNRTLETNLEDEVLRRSLQRRGFKADKTEGNATYFDGGTYNKTTGEASYTEKKLPIVLEKMNKLHKMPSGNTLFWLGIFFGIAPLFFSDSAFFMFRSRAGL